MNPDLSQIKDILDALGALVTPVAGIVVVLYGWKKTGQIDLVKTLDLAGDVLHVVLQGGTTDEAVKEVEKLRKKRLSTKLAGKLKARLDTLVREKGG